MAETLPDKLNLEIVTPEQLLFSGEVNEVTVPGIQGYLGILPGHAPLLSGLQTGVISHRKGNEESHLFCSGGFLEVLEDRVSVLADRAIPADQIDVEQARQHQRQAEEALKSLDEKVDFGKTTLNWREAVAQLEVAAKAGRILS